MSQEIFDVRGGADNVRIVFGINTADIRAKRAMRQTFYRLGKELYAFSRDITKFGKRSGRMYKYKGRMIQASKSPEPPQRRSGFLRESVEHKVHGMDRLEFGDTAAYASFLELGTERMKGPRPFLMPSMQAQEKRAVQIAHEEFEKELGK